jgi:hypothetical protein
VLALSPNKNAPVSAYSTPSFGFRVFVFKFTLLCLWSASEKA